MDFSWWHEWRTKLLLTRNGHGQSGWSPIGCEGLYFHAMCKNRVSVSGWSPIGCEGFHTNLNIPSPPPTNYFSLLLTLSVTHMDFIWCLLLFSVNSWIRYRKIMEHLWVMIQWVHSKNTQKTMFFFLAENRGSCGSGPTTPPQSSLRWRQDAWSTR